MLAADRTADDMDDQYRCSESTGLKSLKRFCKAIIDLYGAEYLRKPNDDDMRALMDKNLRRGWPG